MYFNMYMYTITIIAVNGYVHVLHTIVDMYMYTITIIVVNGYVHVHHIIIVVNGYVHVHHNNYSG